MMDVGVISQYESHSSDSQRLRDALASSVLFFVSEVSQRHFGLLCSFRGRLVCVCIPALSSLLYGLCRHVVPPFTSIRSRGLGLLLSARVFSRLPARALWNSILQQLPATKQCRQAAAAWQLLCRGVLWTPGSLQHT